MAELDQIVEVLRLLTKDVAEIRRTVTVLWYCVVVLCVIALIGVLRMAHCHG